MHSQAIAPDIVIIAMSAALLGLAILLMPRLVQRLPWITPTKDDTDFVIRMQGTLFTMICLLLAFTLVQTQNYQREARSSVTNEASLLNRMDRLLARYGTDAATSLRPHLLAYSNAIVKDEWPAMIHGEKSDAIHPSWDPLSRGILALTPTSVREEALFSELLTSLNDVVEARDTRLSTVPLKLPYTYWAVILFGVVVLLFISSTLEPTAFRATNMVAQMAALGALLGFVFIQDKPFMGENALGPDAIVHAMDIMKKRVN